jgi:signal transduction histidine kinase
MRQYWRDFESLERWTRTEPHRDWWKQFLRDTGGTGFWHELYSVPSDVTPGGQPVSRFIWKTTDGSNTPSRWQVAEDVTEKRQLETQLRQSQKMQAIGQLAGGVAHDFNNPLSVIFGHGALLAAAFPLGERLRDSVVDINLAAERAAALTRQLLTFSRLIAAVRIGNRYDHRLLGEIQPSRGVERVEIRPNNGFQVRWGILRKIYERVHWPPKSFPRFDIADLFARYVHGDERVKIEVRVDSDRVGLLLSGGLLRFGCVYRNWR